MTTIRRPKNATMHFEQIPVDIVKQIAPPEGIREHPPTPMDEAVDRRARQTASFPDAGHFHGVQFYTDSDALCRIVGGFLGEGLEHGTLGVMIVTPDHAARIESCLRRRGIDVEALKGLGRLAIYDARETLQLFMRDGRPNPGAFRRAVGRILTDVRRGRGHCAIRAYGEMVDLLWKDGSEAAAIYVETLWNQLGSTYDFELLCGYSMGNFYKGAALAEIRSQHTHAISGDGSATALSVAVSG